jgi:hypothetical protein
LGIEFDTHFDTTNTTLVENKDHISIWKNGDMNTPVGDPVYALDGGAPLDSDGRWYHIEVVYRRDTNSSTISKTGGGTIQIYLDPAEDVVKVLDTKATFTPTLRLSRQIGSLDFLGDNVMWGFTSATGLDEDKDGDRHRVRLMKGLQYGQPNVDADTDYSRYEFQKW